MRVAPSLVEIPLVVTTGFEVSLRKMAVKIRNSLPQRTLCFFHGQRRRNHPEAKLFALEARLEIEHQRIEQILLRLVEVTEVCSPAHVPDDANARFSQLARRRLGCHKANQEAECCRRASRPARKIVAGFEVHETGVETGRRRV